MKKTPESISRRNRLRKTKAKRKVTKSRSQYASKKTNLKSKSKSLTRKTNVKKSTKVRKVASPMRMKLKTKSKKIAKHVMPEPSEIKIVAVEELEKPSCGCGM